MKPTLAENEQLNLLKTTFSTTGWALCIGAGTSKPVFPDWNELVEMLISEKIPIMQTK